MQRQHLLAVSTLLLAASLVVGGPNGCSERQQPSPPNPETIADIEERLNAILAMDDAIARAGDLSEFFTAARPEDSPAVLRAIDGSRIYVDEVAAILLANWWSRHDPRAAYLDRVASRSLGRLLWDPIVVREWARTDFDEALATVEARRADSGASESHTNQALITGWFESGTRDDPTELLKLIMPLSVGRERSEAMDAFCIAMIEHRGIEPTIEYIENLPAGSLRDFKQNFFRRLVTAMARVDPRRAVAWAEEQAEGPYGKHLLRRVGARWGWVEGEPAIEWAIALPESEDRPTIIEHTYRGFKMRDRERASAWMRKQEYRPVLEPAYAIYLIDYGREEPADAIALTARIEDETLRNKARGAIGHVYMREDPEAATAWLATVELPQRYVDSIMSQKGDVAEASAVGGETGDS